MCIMCLIKGVKSYMKELYFRDLKLLRGCKFGGGGGNDHDSCLLSHFRGVVPSLYVDTQRAYLSACAQVDKLCLANTLRPSASPVYRRRDQSL